jgi:hypothetical protein
MKLIDMLRGGTTDIGSAREVTPEELRNLAQRAITNTNRVVWRFFDLDFVTGFMNLQLFADTEPSLCQLRVIDNPRLCGLKLTHQLLPLPPGDHSFLGLIVDAINRLTFLPTAAAAAVAGTDLLFTTVTLEGPDGFTQDKLLNLVEYNWLMSRAIARAALARYHGNNTEGESVLYLERYYRDYMENRCPPSIISAFEWGMKARAVR